MDVVYLKFNENTITNSNKVYVKDVGSVICSNKELADKICNILVINMGKISEETCVISVMLIVEKIIKDYSGCQVVNLGCEDFIIEYQESKNKNMFLEYIKVFLTCSIVFIGSMFSIMAYNNDVGLTEIFETIYRLMNGGVNNKLLEIGYSLGLLAGISVFYNHFVGKKLSNKPTPIEISMTTYEKDCGNAIIKKANRTGVEKVL